MIPAPITVQGGANDYYLASQGLTASPPLSPQLSPQLSPTSLAAYRKRKGSRGDESDDNNSEGSGQDDSGDEYQANAANHAPRLSKFTIEDLKAVYHLQCKDAAKQLGINTAMLKMCRESLNIPTWPHRKLHSLAQLEEVIRQQTHIKEQERQALLAKISHERAMVYENPEHVISGELDALRQTKYKLKYYHKTKNIQKDTTDRQKQRKKQKDGTEDYTPSNTPPYSPAYTPGGSTATTPGISPAPSPRGVPPMHPFAADALDIPEGGLTELCLDALTLASPQGAQSPVQRLPPSLMRSQQQRYQSFDSNTTEQYPVATVQPYVVQTSGNGAVEPFANYFRSASRSSNHGSGTSDGMLDQSNRFLYRNTSYNSESYSGSQSTVTRTFQRQDSSFNSRDPEALPTAFNGTLSSAIANSGSGASQGVRQCLRSQSYSSDERRSSTQLQALTLEALSLEPAAGSGGTGQYVPGQAPLLPLSMQLPPLPEGHPTSPNMHPLAYDQSALSSEDALLAHLDDGHDGETDRPMSETDSFLRWLNKIYAPELEGSPSLHLQQVLATASAEQRAAMASTNSFEELEQVLSLIEPSLKLDQASIERAAWQGFANFQDSRPPSASPRLGQSPRSNASRPASPPVGANGFGFSASLAPQQQQHMQPINVVSNNTAGFDGASMFQGGFQDHQRHSHASALHNGHEQYYGGRSLRLQPDHMNTTHQVDTFQPVAYRSFPGQQYLGQQQLPGQRALQSHGLQGQPQYATTTRSLAAVQASLMQQDPVSLLDEFASGLQTCTTRLPVLPIQDDTLLPSHASFPQLPYMPLLDDSALLLSQRSSGRLREAGMKLAPSLSLAGSLLAWDTGDLDAIRTSSSLLKDGGSLFLNAGNSLMLNMPSSLVLPSPRDVAPRDNGRIGPAPPQ